MSVVFTLDTWLVPDCQLPAQAYLDVSDWRTFLDWLAQDSNHRVSQLLNGAWRVCLFKSLLNRHFGGSGQRTKELNALGIKLDESCLRNDDEMFISEVLRVYFNNDPGARPQAELLTLARRSEGSGLVTIISQHRGFWRIPLVDTYFVPLSPQRGSDDLPAQFDFVRDFGIHSQLARIIADRIGTPQHGDTINAAIVALRDYIRNMSGLPTEGRSLMEQAFSQDGTHCRLNPLTDLDQQGSQQNEQRGFRELYAAIWTGLRNPLIHEGADSPFAQTRYPDKRTVLKYLSFLSILFERADGPLP
jgi:uncharacterized protein (TIGR02391 family)